MTGRIYIAYVKPEVQEPGMYFPAVAQVSYVQRWQSATNEGMCATSRGMRTYILFYLFVFSFITIKQLTHKNANYKKTMTAGTLGRLREDIRAGKKSWS